MIDLIKRSLTRLLVGLVFIPLLFGAGIRTASSEVEYVKFDEVRATQLMLSEINRMRTDAGLGTVVLDPELSVVSRANSLDMAQRSFFNHINPDGLDANARVRRWGLNCIVSENIGVYRTSMISISRIIDDLMTSFYNSQSHRVNLLDPDATHVGIGFYQDAGGVSDIFDDGDNAKPVEGYGTIFVTQNFYRREIARTEPATLPAQVATGEEVEVTISTLSDFDALSLQFEREGLFSEEYLVRIRPEISREYKCKVRFAEEGRWACHVIGLFDSGQVACRGIGQMEFVVK